MPRVKLTKTVIDALPTPPCDIVYWDAALPGFGDAGGALDFCLIFAP